MPKITGLKAVQAALKRKKLDGKVTAEVEVGYTQTYALIVHEDLTAEHKEGKQAKYLEMPARRSREEIGRVVVDGYQKTRSMPKALLLGGLRLLRESDLIVPIDTAALKASGYVALEEEADKVSKEAFIRSEAVRASALNRRAKQRSKKKK